MTELIGHTQVAARFAEALQCGRLHHAWLLHGLRGVGKQQLAAYLASRYLCEQHSGCGECHACRMIAADAHPDLQLVGLVEGKRDISIDQIRELLGFLSLSGRESERRVVILDDADRMNGQAANALLKGLEEPSPGSLLLIVCHDLTRLPATIRSRCLLQHCSVLTDDECRQVLETLPVEHKYKELAVDLAEGCPGSVACMRDEAIAAALLGWQQLVEDIGQADVGRVEEWVRQHVASVPHALVAKLLVRSGTQARMGISHYDDRAGVEAALWECLRWPGDVVRHSLRAGPALLATFLRLRSALRTA